MVLLINFLARTARRLICHIRTIRIGGLREQDSQSLKSGIPILEDFGFWKRFAAILFFKREWIHFSRIGMVYRLRLFVAALFPALAA
jgi:hypothetical protein